MQIAQFEPEALGTYILSKAIRSVHMYIAVHKFILATDHHPLCKLFGHADGTSAVATALMQQWAFILSAFLLN